MGITPKHIGFQPVSLRRYVHTPGGVLPKRIRISPFFRVPYVQADIRIPPVRTYTAKRPKLHIYANSTPEGVLMRV